MTLRTNWGSAAAAAGAAAALLLAGCTSSETAKQSYSDTAASDAAGAAEAGADAAVGVALGAFAPLGVGGYDTDLSDCNAPGDHLATTLTPVIVTNTYGTDQTFSITINPRLSGDAMWIPIANFGGAQDYDGCSITKITDGAPTTFDVTVPAGETQVTGYLLAGGGETGTNNDGQDNNIAIGAGGTQWYDFWLHTEVIDFSFRNFELNYNGTGGTDPTQNVQTGLFNGLQCTVSSDGSSVSIDNPLALTTHYGGGANVWTFNINQPICFGFLQPNSVS